MNDVIFLKLGGSVITNKESTESTLREELLLDIFSYIKDWQENHPQTKLLLVHGGGGHIHYLAKKYELETSCNGQSEKIKQALELQDVCEALNRQVVGLGLTQELPLTSLPTHEVVTNTDAVIDTINVKAIEQLWNKQQIPFMYGDMVSDTKRDLSICSGDAIISFLSPILKPKRILYASDIDGLYTANPHLNPEAELITSLSSNELSSENIQITGSHNIDTTDGLRGKLKNCQHLYLKNEQLNSIEIFNGLNAKNIESALYQEPFTHTIITK